jgi:5-methylcytosine-specific restriction endonuclease McrA
MATVSGSSGTAGRDVARARVTRTGLDAPVLVLNRHFQPVRITSAKQAFLLLYIGRARALDRRFEPHAWEGWARAAPEPEDETVGTTRGPVRVPRVLLLGSYARVPQAPMRLSRRNIFLRDGFACQYCGVRPGVRELNLDHVLPRSRGGRSSWENLATSCHPCNLTKGRRTPEEAGMSLRARPSRPSWSMALWMAAPSTRYPEWEPFLAGAPERDPDREGEAAE